MPCVRQRVLSGARGTEGEITHPALSREGSVSQHLQAAHAVFFIAENAMDLVTSAFKNDRLYLSVKDIFTLLIKGTIGKGALEIYRNTTGKRPS